MPLWLICLLIGIVIGFVAVTAMKSQLKTVHRQSGASNYLTPGSLQLSVNRDTYLYENTTRTPRAKSNNDSK